MTEPRANTGLLLHIWQQLGLQPTLAAAVGAIAPELVSGLPLDILIVRHLAIRRLCVETLAAARPHGSASPQHTVDALTARTLEGLLGLLRDRTVLTVSPPTANLALSVALPAGIRGQTLIVPLWWQDHPLGLLLVVAPPGLAFAKDHVRLAERLAEPFSAAVARYHQNLRLTAEREAAAADRETLLAKLGRREITETIVGADGGLREVMGRVDQVARSDVPVLIFGETGSGKEVVARAIHSRSGHAVGPFLRVNCGAIPTELVDSELFGHERGSFTGAVHQRKGWFERADGGTLFLDEVAELSPAAQVRLLRVLQDGTFERVGGQQSLRVHVRIVAATHRDLFAMVRDGAFREDLWYRLSVFPIDLPALRDRPEDLPALASHFAERASLRFGLPAITPSRADIDLLYLYSWPGNIRELATVIDRAAILGNGEHLAVAAALGLTRSTGPGRPFQARLSLPTEPPPFESLDQAVVAHIERVLAATGGRIEGPRGAARVLGVNPHTLRSRMRRLGIDWARFRG